MKNKVESRDTSQKQSFILNSADNPILLQLWPRLEMDLLT